MSDSIQFGLILENSTSILSVQVSSDLYYYLGLYESEFATYSSSTCIWRYVVWVLGDCDLILVIVLQIHSSSHHPQIVVILASCHFRTTSVLPLDRVQFLPYFEKMIPFQILIKRWGDFHLKYFVDSVKWITVWHGGQ